jgi:hypothetical protein
LFVASQKKTKNKKNQDAGLKTGATKPKATEKSSTKRQYNMRTVNWCLTEMAALSMMHTG